MGLRLARSDETGFQRDCWRPVSGGGLVVCRVRRTGGRSGVEAGCACCLLTSVWLGPFEGVPKNDAGAPLRVLPVAASCACLSLPFLSGAPQAARDPARRLRGRQTPAARRVPIWAAPRFPDS